jgi:predicted P-loop ATPase
MVMLPTPWEQGANGQWAPRAWTDRDDVLCAEWYQRHEIAVSIPTAAAAVQAIAQEHAFHPVKDYLGGLKWDGLNRVEGFAANYLGADDSTYHAAVGRCTLVAAVARIFTPGCKADHIPILEGAQGTFKSSVLAALFTPWFSDDLADLGTKDCQMQMNGVWCLEIAELASMRRADIEKVNAFASRREDRYRPSYGRNVIKAPRQCIVVGTTNSDQYLKDETGARRFWPVRCGRISLDAAVRDRDQLWAEAVALYRDGTEWWLTGAGEIAAAKAEQDTRYAEDAWAASIDAFVEGKDSVTTAEILTHLGKPVELWSQLDQKRVVACLRVQGCWQRRQQREGGRRRWVYARQGDTR